MLLQVTTGWSPGGQWLSWNLRVASSADHGRASKVSHILLHIREAAEISSHALALSPTAVLSATRKTAQTSAQTATRFLTNPRDTFVSFSIASHPVLPHRQHPSHWVSGTSHTFAALTQGLLSLCRSHHIHLGSALVICVAVSLTTVASLTPAF